MNGLVITDKPIMAGAFALALSAASGLGVQFGLGWQPKMSGGSLARALSRVLRQQTRAKCGGPRLGRTGGFLERV